MNKLTWDKEIADKVASLMLESNSYIVNFSKPKDQWIKLPSGNITPCYCNCRYISRNPIIYRKISNYLKSLIMTKYKDTDVIVGLATAGISWATHIADFMNLPMAYVRGTNKGYGVRNLVECNPPRSKNAIIIDDACFSGDSIITAIKALREEYDISCIGVAVIITLSSEKGENRWDEILSTGVKIFSLTDYSNILFIAKNMGIINDKQFIMLNNFYKNPNSYIW